MIKLLAFDVDGTLSPGGNTMSQNLGSVLNLLKSQGMQIVLASGRSYPDLYEFQKQNQFFVPSILLNGAAISDKEGNIYDCVYMDEKDVETICTTFNTLHLPYVCYTKDQILDLSNEDNSYRKIMKQYVIQDQGIQRFFSLFTKAKTIPKKEILKIEAVFNNPKQIQEVKEVLKVFPRIHIVSSMGFNLEITDIQANKGNALANYVKSLNLSKEEVMVFGDSENDISMFDLFPHSVFVDNGNRIYQTEYTTSSCENDGVYSFLKQYFL